VAANPSLSLCLFAEAVVCLISVGGGSFALGYPGRPRRAGSQARRAAVFGGGLRLAGLAVYGWAARVTIFGARGLAEAAGIAPATPANERSSSL